MEVPRPRCRDCPAPDRPSAARSASRPGTGAASSVAGARTVARPSHRARRCPVARRTPSASPPWRADRPMHSASPSGTACSHPRPLATCADPRRAGAPRRRRAVPATGRRPRRGAHHALDRMSARTPPPIPIGRVASLAWPPVDRGARRTPRAAHRCWPSRRRGSGCRPAGRRAIDANSHRGRSRPASRVAPGRRPPTPGRVPRK